MTLQLQRDESRSTSPCDPVLLPLLRASDEDSRREHIEHLLIEHATPTIEMVIARFMKSEQMIRRDDAEDVAATVVLLLVRKLHTILRTEDEAIVDFENYVATLTYRTIYGFMRRRFPERTRHKNRIRYLLTHDERFALWSTSEGLACGLRRWLGRTDTLAIVDIDRGRATHAMLDRDRPHDAIAALLERVGGPLPLETLVGTTADLWGIAEPRDEANAVTRDLLPSHGLSYERRELLENLWKEIQLLPQNQRTALLLNLRAPEGVNAVALFILVGIASYDDIATVLGVISNDLASLWENLPLDDLTIAARLNMTRQQIINLRRAARERLTRRTNMFGRSDERT